jgi:hypothetical protein
LTQPLSAAELGALYTGDLGMAYTRWFHAEHCLYAMRKMAYAVSKKTWMVDNKAGSWHHSDHCVKQVAKLLRTGYEHSLNEAFVSAPSEVVLKV